MATIKFKQIGQNLILNVDDQQFSKAFPDKEEREQVKGLVKELDTKYTKKTYDKIVKFFTTNTEKAKKEEETAKVAKKAVEKKIKKETTKAKVEQEVVAEQVVKDIPVLEEMVRELEKENAELKSQLINKPVAKPTTRKGEY